MTDATRERILDVAEGLFAEHGLVNTSLRAITSLAAVNLAAVNYHFGSKDGLIREVFARRLVTLNRERVRRLDALADDAPVEDVLGAFIAPALELNTPADLGGQRFIRLLGRTYFEAAPELRAHIHGLYAEVFERAKVAFARALPELPALELYWRLHFMLGAVSYTMAGTDLMQIVAACELATQADGTQMTQRLIPFLAAGLRAPLPPGLAQRPAAA